MSKKAPHVFISYSHDSNDHKEQVLALSERLRQDGIHTQLDQYVNGTPAERWPRWMLNQLDKAQFVLVVCTETYYRRFRGLESPNTGKGVDWEGALITQEIYDARSQELKFVPILFTVNQERFIPELLRGQAYYTLSSNSGYTALYDFLLGQAAVEPGMIGELKQRPRRQGKPLTFDQDDHDISTADQKDATEIKIIPKGLRSFGDEDKDFFLELLPGPRRQGGLPDSVWFWKKRIETTDPDQAFTVGLIYGPSGCGKSSLVKAGLLPQLNHVIAVYLEATAEDTELRILRGIRKHKPEIPENAELVATLTALKNGNGPKVVLIVDQFEQWLHAHRSETEPDLIRAFRHCDGKHLQVILMVRDGFFMAIDRFMSVLDITIDKDRNFATVDLFDIEHAKKILKKFGTAYGRLREEGRPLSEDQKAFISQMATKLSKQGRVVAVRLALFAEMVKNKPWVATLIKDKDTLEEVGVQFLEETFDSSQAHPTHRRHGAAAEKVLKALLPEPGAEIKGHMGSHAELVKASGYNPHSPKEFETLLRILDRETRLITPTDPEGREQDGEFVESENVQGRFYQLTHDYLVPSLREWLNRKLRETRRGRAELLLEERAAQWHKKPESRFLPNLLEWIRIEFLVKRTKWNDQAQQMMGAARRVYVTWATVIAFLVLILSYAGWHGVGRLQARSLVDSLVKAKEDAVVGIIEQLRPYQRWTQPHLLEVLSRQAETNSDWRGQRHARMALLAIEQDESQIAVLQKDLLTAEPATIGLLCRVLKPHAFQIEDDLWQTLHDPTARVDRRFRAGLALSEYAPQNTRWTSEDYRFLAQQLVGANPEHQLRLRQYLRSVSHELLSNLEVLFSDPELTESHRLSAANALADFAGNDSRRMVRLLTLATPDQHQVLYPLFYKSPNTEGRKEMEKVVAEQSSATMSHTHRISLGQRRAVAAITLLRLGVRDGIFPALRVGNDPESLTQFIHRCRNYGVRPHELLERVRAVDKLRQAKTGTARQQEDRVLYALLLALGDYSLADLSEADRKPLIEQLASWYAQDPSSAIHGASGWLLRHWQQSEKARKVERTAVPYDPNREWFTLEIKLSDTMTSYFTFVVFPSDKYEIGSPEDEPDRDKDEDRHTMELTRPFAILDREITMAELIAFKSERYGFYMDQVDGVPEDTGYAVSWYDAVRFCRWLTQLAGMEEENQPYLDPESLKLMGFSADPDPDAEGAPENWPIDMNKSGFRLPTEAEWEIAARASMHSPYSFGRDVSMLSNYGWFLGNSGRKVQLSRMKRPNLRGMFDMHGNVWEWCHDWYGNYPTGTDGVDPQGPERGSVRVDRGGGWDDDSASCRAANRGRIRPAFRSSTLGFRLAIVLFNEVSSQ